LSTATRVAEDRNWTARRTESARAGRDGYESDAVMKKYVVCVRVCGVVVMIMMTVEAIDNRPITYVENAESKGNLISQSTWVLTTRVLIEPSLLW